MRGVLVALLATMVVAAPLAFGGAIRQAEVWLEVGAALALLFAAFLPRPVNHAAGPSPVRRALVLVGWALAGLVGLGLVQSLALPGGVVAAISPEHAKRWADASGFLGRALQPHLSLDPAASRATALLLAAALATGLAAAAVADRRGARRVLAVAVLVAALFQGLFGAWRWGPRTAAIWGVETPDGSARMRGTYVNPDHLADLLAIALAVAFAAAWLGLRRTRERSAERRVLLVAPPVLAWITLFVTLAFTGSRAGLAAAMLGAALQAVLVSVRRFGRRRALLLAVLVVGVGIGAVAFVGLRQGLGRFLDQPVGEGLGSRGQAYTATLALWQRFPFLGSGLGSFRAAFPLVQPSAMSGAWWHAHSDALELLATAGIFGCALGGLALFALARGLLALWRQAERSEERAMALAALGAAVAVLAHELVDFGLTMPANALVLAVVCGLALGTPRDAVKRRASHPPR